jgi:hypothetical protein
VFVCHSLKRKIYPGFPRQIADGRFKVTDTVGPRDHAEPAIRVLVGVRKCHHFTCKGLAVVELTAQIEGLVLLCQIAQAMG